MSYLKITTIVQATENADYSGPSQVPSTAGYEETPETVSYREFEATDDDHVQIFPDVTATSNVRTCIIQVLGEAEIVLYLDEVPVAVVPVAGTMAFSPIYGAANQLLYTVKTNGDGPGLVRVTSTTLDGYGAA